MVLFCAATMDGCLLPAGVEFTEYCGLPTPDARWLYPLVLLCCWGRFCCSCHAADARTDGPVPLFSRLSLTTASQVAPLLGGGWLRRTSVGQRVHVSVLRGNGMPQIACSNGQCTFVACQFAVLRNELHGHDVLLPCHGVAAFNYQPMPLYRIKPRSCYCTQSGGKAYKGTAACSVEAPYGFKDHYRCQPASCMARCWLLHRPPHAATCHPAPATAIPRMLSQRGVFRVNLCNLRNLHFPLHMHT